MKLISTSDLKVGQAFSEAVYTEGEYLLVTAMKPLRQRDIDVLRAWDIDYVRTKGSFVEIKELSDADKALSDLEAELAEALEETDDLPDTQKNAVKFSISDVRQNSGPYQAYKNLIERLNKVFNDLKTGHDVQMRIFDDICMKLLQDLRENPDKFVGFILGGEVAGNELAKSSVNSAILSALMAQELKLPHHKIHNVVLGALLHDVGMLRLSKGITEKKGGLSDAELDQIKSHPLHTSKIVTKELFGPHEVNLIALHHHERWDGKGYPDHLVGSAIDIGARIVSVADAFEAMVSKKSYRNSMIGYQAIKNLLADNARRFDPAVINVFTKIMGIYPIGSIVRLNDSSIARVINIHTDAPMRPIVQMLTDNSGNVIGSGNVTTIDLLEVKTLFIKEAIDPAEFKRTNA
ncbi:MAG: HD-GYP domain-containing protein [Treponema sp.]|nr:HD-GYP domain-containing protein [Treponema sp.]